jgi:hypothetical protein
MPQNTNTAQKTTEPRWYSYLTAKARFQQRASDLGGDIGDHRLARAPDEAILEQLLSDEQRPDGIHLR